MSIIIVVPYPIETSGSVEFAKTLCASLSAKSLDVTLAYCQPGVAPPNQSENTPTIDAKLDNLDGYSVCVFPKEEMLLEWSDSQLPHCDIIFWVGFFQKPQWRATQINSSALARQEFGTKVVFMWERTGHTSVVPERRLFVKLIKEASDSIAALNSAHRQMLIDRGADENRVALFSTGIDTKGRFRMPQPEDKASVRKQYGWKAGETLFLVLSRFVLRKRIDFVIDTWNQNPFLCDNAKLVIVGAGFGAPDSNEDKVISMAKKSPSIEVIQYEPGMQQQVFYNAADVFVSASKLEGEPTAILEAMASGLPTIASDIPGHRSVVSTGHNGFLFDLHDRDALSDAMMEMTGDSLLRRQLSDQARLDVVARRDISRIADQFLEIANASELQTSSRPAIGADLTEIE